VQTTFTPEQLRNPDIAASNQVLRTCVHCGFCTATCPTFLLLGDELDSPRGRIYLIKDMLEAGRPAGELEARHIDRCLSCLSCMTTCPSGVHYMHLVDHARTHIAQTYRRPWHERLLRRTLAETLPRPNLFRAALRAGGLLGPLLNRFIPASTPATRRLRAMLALMPARLPPNAIEPPRTHQAQGTRRARVIVLAGCAQQVLAPEINQATIRLLTRLGVEVVVAQGAGCCGALVQHMGRHAEAMTAARANIRAWSREIDAPGPPELGPNARGPNAPGSKATTASLDAPSLDAIVINTSGCGTVVKDYGFQFRNDPLRADAERIAALARDISEVLIRLDYAPTRPPPGLTVAYHAACSLQHGQKITAEPKTLLRRAGFTVVEPTEPHICCGSAGTYNIMQPDIAARLRTRKLDHLRATEPDLIATGNIGCITHLAGNGIPIVHTIELLDWMAGGPRPPAIV
jgi:glycolate oxidase iron-sulfur subunit